MMDEIYNSRILEFAGNIPETGRLADPDAEASAHSKLCGSKVRITLKMDGDTVTGFAHEVKALCAWTSLVLDHGPAMSSAPHLRKSARRAKDMLAMLKADGEGPSGRFEDMRFLKPVRDYKARHASTMLTFDAVVDAIGQVEAKRPVKAAG